MLSSLWPWQILTWPVQIHSRCCHKIIFPAHQFDHIIFLSMLPAWAFSSLQYLIGACLHCQHSLHAVLGHYLQFSDRGRFFFWVARARHSDNPFVPFLTLHLMLGREFPWCPQMNSLFSGKVSKTTHFPPLCIKKKKKNIPGLPPRMLFLLPSQHQLLVSFCSPSTCLSPFVFPDFSPWL